MGIVARKPSEQITWFLLKLIPKTRKDINILKRAVQEYDTLKDLPWERGDDRYGPTIQAGEWFVFFQNEGTPPIPQAIEPSNQNKTIQEFQELLDRVEDPALINQMHYLMNKKMFECAGY